MLSPHHIVRLKQTKYDCGWGSDSEPSGGARSALKPSNGSMTYLSPASGVQSAIDLSICDLSLYLVFS